MRDVNIIQKYNILTKFFHWLSVIGLVVQIPLGFYLVRQEFSDFRITIEEIHVLIGITIFYITLLRLFVRLFINSPANPIEAFPGQMIIAKLNHYLLYLTLLTVTSSGILKKLFNGEKLNFGITEIKLKSNFDYADLSYDVHIYSNYTLIALISLHILAALLHTFVFKDNVIKRIT